MINYHIKVSGMVQGVGFRWSTYQLAQKLGLTGFVKNLPNGQVYIVVQGPSQAMHKFLQAIKDDSITPYGHIEHYDVTPANLGEYASFKISTDW
ncbi:acylphosphatase [Limosilactobacillus secaliphilus]|uniref:Acylphosphatase n=1 Tax=Limosilactobacillus secaliphilus TaxID=396268 RepID=A0A0R2IAZ4_9LACO|nr:acylphosphatase [Limosilactobacillus secaliphilus]KRN59146.1 hypothetical protein IV45_GL000184 [Limosilactobacillus secaliphilus]